MMDQTKRLVTRIKRFNGKTKKWGDWQEFHWPRRKKKGLWEFRLHRGGMLKVMPNCIPEERADLVCNEVIKSGMFRQYQVQSTNEPRVHFLLHDNATTDFEQDQPGYRYGTVVMKSQQLAKLPLAQSLSHYMAQICHVHHWTIGVDVVLYRGGIDYIGEYVTDPHHFPQITTHVHPLLVGKHADNSQGETNIFSLLISSTKEARKVVISVDQKQNKKQQGSNVNHDGDEIIELYLTKTDGYHMDGMMQKNYLHEVPRRISQSLNKARRVALVFRTGEQKIYNKDSGTPCSSLEPRSRKIQYTFGLVEHLREGEIYSKRSLFAMNAHHSIQKGVSGNKKVGCEAIALSQTRKYDQERDDGDLLIYGATVQSGAHALSTSLQTKVPVRIFRFSHQNGSCNFYRYDGLFMVMKRSISAQRAEHNRDLFLFSLTKS